MTLKEIKIKDFRCFKQFSCQFAPGVNVFIGRNGAGKTTLIHAIHRVVSFIFSNNRSLGKEFLSQGNNTLNVRGFKEADYHFDIDLREPAQDATISAKAEYNNQELDWKLYRRNQTNAALYQRYYKEAFAKFMYEWKVEGASLPLLAYYSDSYPHKYVKTVKYALDIVNNGVMPRNFGYYQWDDEAACTSIWETRFCNCYNRVQPYYKLMLEVSSKLKEMEEKYDAVTLRGNSEYGRLKQEEARIQRVTDVPFQEMNFVENRLRQFAEVLPGIGAQGHEIDFLGPAQTNEGFQLLLHFKNGNSSLLQDLPAGYRRLYSIVFDMAYRSYILNGDKEPVGVAVIDEIDLHLHPELEKDVLNVFHQTFLGIQFIVSTHSPMVLTNLQNSEGECWIMRMELGDDHPVVINDIYGLDYNTGVEDVMGVEASNVEIDNLLDTLAYYVDNDLGEQAQNVRSLLLKKLNDNESRLNELLAKRIEEMGDEIHR